MHDDDTVHEQACEVEAEDGIVVVTGPDELRARFTPDAAEEMAERLATGAMKARGQRYFSDSLKPKP